MLVLTLIVAALAVARITRLLVRDQLTISYRRWVINRWGENGKMGYLVHCPWCTSIWVALPIMPIAVFWPNRWILAILAIPTASMISGLLDRE